MPVPIPGSQVRSDNQKVKFLTISGRPKTWIFREFRGVPGGPKALNMDTPAARILEINILSTSTYVFPGGPP